MSPARVRAPELTGRGGWINTGGKSYSIADFRGRLLILDFWTFCCVNCLHVLEELRPLEHRYADVLVTVGVHSPKFAHEADHDAVRAAVARYAVRHPVLDDPDLTTWQAYAVRAWPTLTLIDPEGFIVAQLSGEGHAHTLDALLAELVAEHGARGTLRRGDSPYVPVPPRPGTLSFPGKVVRLPDTGTLLVSDTAGHALVELGEDLQTVVRRIGTGERGLVDGPGERAEFAEPQGLCLLPEEVAERVGYDVVVADSVNHALRGVRLADATVRTLAGTGRAWTRTDPLPTRAAPAPGRSSALSTPWDVAWWPALGQVVVAMAGIHQLWCFDPLGGGSVAVLAGTTNEGLRDGPAEAAWFAQTSGLSASADGATLWLADAETSSLRALRLEGERVRVRTHVGTGLFDFGLRDGPAAHALLQHPLGVTALPDDSVAIADTYNGAVRRYDPSTGQVSTLATGLAEPSGAAVDGEHLVVVESAAHRLSRIRLGAAAIPAAEFARRTRRPPTEIAAGEVELVVRFTPPPGEKLDERYGPPTRLLVSSTPPALLREGEGRGSELTRRLVIDPAIGEGVLHVAAQAASCDLPDPDGAESFPACHVHQQDWGVPVRVSPAGTRRLVLMLSGPPEG